MKQKPPVHSYHLKSGKTFWYLILLSIRKIDRDWKAFYTSKGTQRRVILQSRNSMVLSKVEEFIFSKIAGLYCKNASC